MKIGITSEFNKLAVPCATKAVRTEPQQGSLWRFVCRLWFGAHDFRSDDAEYTWGCIRCGRRNYVPFRY